MLEPNRVHTEFVCRSCGDTHAGLPLAYTALAPAYVDAMDDDERVRRVVIDGELCVVDDRHFFVRARLLVPILDHDDAFEWGVWASLSESNYRRTVDVWSTPGREAEPPYFGWLSTALPEYSPTTLNLKCMVHTQPLSVRPTVELEPTDHPLAIEQRRGISFERVRVIAGRLLRPE
jgi:hypothetical protein